MSISLPPFWWDTTLFSPGQGIFQRVAPLVLEKRPSFMQRASLASEAAFAEGTSNVSSPLASPASGAFVYVNFPAEQAARDDLASP